jgi:Fic family protein
MPKFNHFDLALPNPSFDSPLVDVLNELEYLRRLELGGTTPAPVFFQLKAIFHMLESLGSARIEGNHTTLADYVESKLEGTEQAPTDQLREMENIEKAMKYIEEHFKTGDDIAEVFIGQLHAIAVEALEREGDDTPGAYRQKPVQIAQSEHLPPGFVLVPQYMHELVTFINRKDPPKYDLIKIAMTHHRFGWIHPFGNGNGRVVRLLTYTLLIKFGFNVKAGGRVLNPTAVFCNDRDVYYAMLATADKGTAQGIEAWCEYVLKGILEELRKVDKLSDFDFLGQKIILPALRFAKERQWITANEEAILQLTAGMGVAKASDFKELMKSLSDAQRTYQIKKLVERKLLLPISQGSRQYTIGFSNNYLVRGVIRALTNEGFVPASLNDVKN